MINLCAMSDPLTASPIVIVRELRIQCLKYIYLNYFHKRIRVAKENRFIFHDEFPSENF